MLKLSTPVWDLLVNKRILPNGEAIYLVMNTSGRKIDVTLTAPEKQPVAVADIQRREFHAVTAENGSWQWSFAPYAAYCFILGETEVSSAPATPTQEIRTLNNWTLAPVNRFYADEPRTEKICAAPIPVKLGDWQDILGTDFSGDAEYTTTFRCDCPEEKLFLDLGEVKYACEVKLNGKSLGKKFFPPYVFELQGKVKRGINKLTVTVTNTLANAIDEKVQEYWKINHPPVSPYNILEKEFEKESLASGLFGPVKLLK
jgi:hypothetical protein